MVSVDVHLHVNSSGSNGKSFGIFLNSQPNSPILLTEFLNGIWHSLSPSFVATSTTHTIIFASELDARTPGVPSTTDVSYWIDNASLDLRAGGAVPEPGMYWLLGSGLSALLLRRRRR